MMHNESQKSSYASSVVSNWNLEYLNASHMVQTVSELLI